jgi:rod shape-determining protein MreC
VLNNNVIGKSGLKTFVKRHQVILISLALLLVSLHLALTDKRDAERGMFVKEVLAATLAPVQNAILGAYNAVTGVMDDYIFLVKLKEENEDLKETVEALKGENNRLAEEVFLGERLKEVLAYKQNAPFTTNAAGIIAFNVDRWTRTVTINKGFDDGVAKDMSVITSAGVVGRIIEVSEHTSRVLLSTDLRSNIEAIVQRTRVKGVVEGNGTGGLILKYVRQLDDVTLGDKIVTSGFSELFPKGLVIGEVTRVSKGRDNFFKEIEVRPMVEFDKLEDVLVVTGPARAAAPSPPGPGSVAGALP